MKRAKWVFNISDLWPESALVLGIIKKGFCLDRIITELEEYLYSKANIITCHS